MISAQTDETIQEELIKKYMSLPNQVWNEIIQKANIDVNILIDHGTIKQLDNIIKTNYHACKALGHNYLIQLKCIYMDMLGFYEVMSKKITEAISKNGEVFMKQPLIRSMCGLKKEILKLINEWVYHSTDHEVVLQSFVPKLFDVILLDYKKCEVASAREPEVLSTTATVVKKLMVIDSLWILSILIHLIISIFFQHNITPQIPIILDSVFECTLEMINKDFEEYPEHRTNLYMFLQEVVTYCFPALLQILPNQFKLILDSIIWAIKHTMRNVAETGMKILLTLLENITKNPQQEIINGFYQTYYRDILHHMFAVATDSSHASGIFMQSKILAFMFEIIDTNRITVPLDPEAQRDGMSNIDFVKEYVRNLLKSAFGHLTDIQMQVVISGFFALHQDAQAFKEHLRDFLVQINVRLYSIQISLSNYE